MIEYKAKADILVNTYTDQGFRSPFICAKDAPVNRQEIEGLLINEGATRDERELEFKEEVCHNDSYMEF